MSAHAEKLNHSTGHGTEAVLSVDRDRVVTVASDQAHELLGYAKGTLHGLSLEWLSPPSRHPELKNLSAVFEGQGTRKIRSVALRADGSVVDVTMVIRPRREAGQIVGADLRYELPAARPRLTAPPPPPPPREKALLSRRPETSNTNALAAHDVPPVHSVIVEKRGPRNEVLDQLESVMQLLGWLDTRLSAPLDTQPLDDPRERARAILVLNEARSLLDGCRRELAEPAPASAPKAPKPPSW